MTNKETIKLLRDALIGLVGSSERAELEQMELVLRTVPTPDCDKVSMLNAIRAIINTEPKEVRNVEDNHAD